MQTKVEMNRTEKDAVAVEKTAQNSSGQGSEKINGIADNIPAGPTVAPINNTNTPATASVQPTRSETQKDGRL